MSDIIPYYKPLGMTPLQAIEKLKSERPELSPKAITYAGRLDPMAEGLLLLLTGDAIARKQELLDLPKTYEAKILLGFESDTFDILGLAKLIHEPGKHKNPQELITAVESLGGTHKFFYPLYSSKTVNGKPLWLLAKENKIERANLPTREMTVLSAENITTTSEPWPKVYTQITSSISLVDGDFRQEQILQQWAEINKNVIDPEVRILSVQLKVTSGTYIRTIANELGKLLGTGALLLHLKRTSIGNFEITQ